MKLSLSNNSFYFISPEDAMEKIKNVGFDAMDYRMTEVGIWKNPEKFFSMIERHKNAAEKCGIFLGQTHGPYMTPCDDDEKTKELFEAQKMSIKAAEILGIPYLVFHVCVYSGHLSEEERKIAGEKNIAWFSRLIPYLKNSPVKVCIENCYIDLPDESGCYPTFGSCGEEMVYLIDSLNEKAGFTAFGACLDVGHCHTCGGDAPRMARLLGKRLLALHLHDNDRRNDYHLPPFCSANGIDWEELAKALGEIEYKGTLNFEIDSLIVRRSPELTQATLELFLEIGKEFRHMIKGGRNV
ncbi:MAG: sugar phosphate isomerase/epimerase [Clostridia bacterium]|nr:sugar phosphate isomerase/epimerase [Clostridia bacterium]